VLPREVLKTIRRIEIRTSRLAEESFAGEYHSVFKGRGVEFSEVREYQPGDDVRIIDWNVTSRMGHPFVKVFVEERELTVILLVDVSGSFNFGTRGRLKAELAAEVAAVLGFSALRNNDRVGAVLFTDQVELYVPPRKGRSHVLRTVREVLYYRPQGRGTDIGGALEFLLHGLRKRAVVFLLSDFLDRGYEKELRAARRRHDVVPIVFTDPREEDLPNVGLLEIEDPESGDIRVVDTRSRRFRRGFRKRAEERAAARDALFKNLGIETIRLRTGEPYDAPLVRFFERRARRLRA
jgi:uncharacterized protein (DUF58 family)